MSFPSTSQITLHNKFHDFSPTSLPISAPSHISLQSPLSFFTLFNLPSSSFIFILPSYFFPLCLPSVCFTPSSSSLSIYPSFPSPCSLLLSISFISLILPPSISSISFLHSLIYLQLSISSFSSSLSYTPLSILDCHPHLLPLPSPSFTHFFILTVFLLLTFLHFPLLTSPPFSSFTFLHSPRLSPLIILFFIFLHLCFYPSLSPSLSSPSLSLISLSFPLSSPFSFSFTLLHAPPSLSTCVC